MKRSKDCLKLIYFEQKQFRMDVTQEMLRTFNDDSRFAITSMEASKRANIEKKFLLTVYLDCNGMVQHEFLPQGRMVNKKYYLEVMSRLSGAILQKRT